ncbi:MAG: hypothetical protein OEY49_17245 [Candidatus Heimdallarchaeota archaeon]|nr:hypothetical protein [Candidatus Heimdallarchaeota archaeon]
MVLETIEISDSHIHHYDNTGHTIVKAKLEQLNDTKMYIPRDELILNYINNYCKINEKVLIVYLPPHSTNESKSSYLLQDKFVDLNINSEDINYYNQNAF